MIANLRVGLFKYWQVRQMIKLLRFYAFLTRRRQYNQFIYLLQRLPFIGKYIPNTCYQATQLKTLLVYLTGIWKIIMAFVYRTLYLVALLLLSHLAANYFQPKVEARAYFLTWLVLLSVFLSGVFRSQYLTKDTDTIIAFRIFRLPIRRYLFTKQLADELLLRVSLCLVLLAIFAYLGLPLLSAVYLTLCAMGFSFLMKVLLLATYKAKSDTPDKFLVPITLGLALVFLALTVGTLFGFSLSYQLFYTWQAGVLGFGLTLICSYILLHYPQFDKLARKLLTYEQLQTFDKVMVEAQTQGLDLKPKDINTTTVKGQPAGDGIVYLNQIFYSRVGHHLKRKCYPKLGLLLALLAALWGLALFHKLSFSMSAVTTMWFPMLVLASSIIFSSEFYTKFCFYHMDRQLMRYTFYREPRHLSVALRIRFATICRLHLPLLGLALLGLVGAYLLSNGHNLLALIWLLIIQCIAMLFYSLHFLILYYLLSPFTENLKVKNPVYQIANLIFYSWSAYLSFQLAQLTAHAFLYFIGFCLIYMVLGFVAVLKFSPKTFHLR